MAAGMMAIGKRDRDMDMAERLILMEMSILETIRLACNMGEVLWYGLMEVIMKESFLMELYKEKAFIIGQMAGISMENGWIIKLMVTEHLSGQMERGTLVN